MLKPKFLLYLEGGVLLAISLLFYARLEGSWLLFAVLVLAPDLSALGYLAGVKVGGASYNAAHSYILPAVLLVAGVLTDERLPLLLALIWFAHIGADRLVGYGLKYSTEFKDTHLSHV